MSAFSRLLEVPSLDPDDARRRKLLNIVLLGLILVTLATMILMALMSVLGSVVVAESEATLLYVGFLVIIVGMAIIFLINRYGAGWLAGAAFLMLLILVLGFADEPVEVVNGRSLFMFAIPIIMASVILRPYASFVAAGVVGLFLVALGSSVNVLPSATTVPGFFALAWVSWLSARSVDRALADLRAINRELDQRVGERTQALAEALARVQAESSKNQAILEGIADGVIVFDNNGKAIVANPAIARLINRPPDQIIGSNITALMGEDVSEQERQKIVELLNQETLHSSGVKFQWGNKTLSVSVALVRDASGGAIGTVAVFRDFTKEAEVDRMKSAFVSMASHELRTPLTAIMGYADMIQEAVFGPLSEGQRGAIQRILANSRRMLSLVNNLLDRAQIEAGRLSLHMTEFEPAALIDNLQSVMSVLAENKGLELTCAIADDVPQTLTSDPQRLEQILINLAGNAIKFTEQGAVRVRVFCPDADHWAMEVADTGPGIPAEAQAYIFDPFRQVGDPVIRKHPGSGLGLSIVKQIVTLMGGDVTLTSELNKGSTFTVVLPITPPQEAAS